MIFSLNTTNCFCRLDVKNSFWRFILKGMVTIPHFTKVSVNKGEYNKDESF